ncbi:TrbI/VirB10 family protein [Allosphingosinicella vermicomposti]|uniref:TrbI/VirB10 family protein n=1 Tax=Allosphingosinicella vermicomposti TaxID=614671 RepID=UPI001FE0C32C|nr:TrbI/VirB10 family protein [Allosphingosinicella vermicomposti]
MLRGSPRRVVRFRRGLLIGIAVLAATSISAVTWLALQPASFKLAAQGDERVGPDRKSPPEALSSLPGSYGQAKTGVPDLGPPLPGDLGRPILAHQRAVEMGDAHNAEPADANAVREEVERQRKEAELRAVRTAGVLTQLSGMGIAERNEAERLGVPELASNAPEASAAKPAATLQKASSPWQLNAGTVIAASLLTGINSDLPGLVTAQVTENVTDSATGRTIVIPQGTRLIGRYDSAIAFGQNRALLIWERLVFPNGASMALDNAPASDTSGYAGLRDRTNAHTGRLLKGIALAALLGVGTELSIGGESEIVEALREAGQQSASDAGQQIVSRNLSMKPTITVRPGWPLRVVLHRDLVLQPWRG